MAMTLGRLSTCTTMTWEERWGVRNNIPWMPFLSPVLLIWGQGCMIANRSTSGLSLSFVIRPVSIFSILNRPCSLRLFCLHSTTNNNTASLNEISLFGTAWRDPPPPPHRTRLVLKPRCQPPVLPVLIYLYISTHVPPAWNPGPSCILCRQNSYFSLIR